MDYYESDFRKDWLGWRELPKWKEGNSGNSVDYQTFMFDFVKKHKPKRILEIGFNAGHSACCFLNASPESKMVTFDKCAWGTEEPACEVLKKHFDIELIQGDSTKTVPEFMTQHRLFPNNGYFDFVFIDGGHINDTPRLDMVNTKGKVNVGGHILIDGADHTNVKRCFGRVDWVDYVEIFTDSYRTNNPDVPPGSKDGLRRAYNCGEKEYTYTLMERTAWMGMDELEAAIENEPTQ